MLFPFHTVPIPLFSYNILLYDVDTILYHIVTYRFLDYISTVVCEYYKIQNLPTISLVTDDCMFCKLCVQDIL